MIGAFVQQAVDQRGIAVEGENHRFIDSEQLIERRVRQTMGVLEGRLQHHQVDHIDDPDAQIRHVLAQQSDRRQGFQGRHITGAGHHHVRVLIIPACPVPTTDARQAMSDGCINIQPLPLRLFAGDDDVDVVATFQAVVRHRQQAIGIGRQVDPHHV